jgi:hypothetical protein
VIVQKQLARPFHMMLQKLLYRIVPGLPGVPHGIDVAIPLAIATLARIIADHDAATVDLVFYVIQEHVQLLRYRLVWHQFYIHCLIILVAVDAGDFTVTTG